MITLQDIREAQQRLQGVTRHTPLLPYADAVTTSVGDQVWLKPEQFQPIGSFKLRGAYNRIAAIPESVRQHGVIAYSSGNHAQGVAYSAKVLGIPATIIMPTNAPTVKIEATRSYGANVVLYDPMMQKREEVAQKLMHGQQWTLVPPFNDSYVIAGQGTIGIEIFDDLADVDAVLTPVGGGGLIGGTATALKSLKPSIRVIGVEPALAADAQASLRSGHIVEISAADTGRTIADGVRTLALGELTFDQMRQYVDDIITVSEEEIRSATRQLILQARLLTEPTGALAMAGYLYHREELGLPAGARLVLVLSGGNIDPTLLTDLLIASDDSVEIVR
ncbi:MAG: threonine/serine dehydratase [Anaerolineae bacterium]|nr:threonine/serine dehydratase [Anaerolineae bacterium]